MKKRIKSYVALIILAGIFCTFIPPTLVQATTYPPMQINADFRWNDTEKTEISWDYKLPIADTDPPKYQDEHAVFHHEGTYNSADINYTVDAGSGGKTPPSPPILFDTYGTDGLKLSLENITTTYNGKALLIVDKAANRVYGVITIKIESDGSHYVLLEAAPENDPLYFMNRSGFGPDPGGNPGVAVLSQLNSTAGPFGIKERSDDSTAIGLCTNMAEDWISLKKNIRSMLIPAPGSIAGHSENNHWQVYDTGAAHTGNIIISAVLGSSFKKLQKITGMTTAEFFDIDPLDLTTQGMITINDIGSDATKLKADIDKLKAMSSGSDTITVSCGSGVVFKEMKWNDTLENSEAPMKTFSELVDDIDAKTEFVKYATGSLDDSDSQGACGSATGIGDVIQIALCNLTLMVRAWGLSFFCYAQTKMSDVLGQVDMTSTACTTTSPGEARTRDKLLK